MFIDIDYEITNYTRVSKLGKAHSYKRKKTLVILRCDSCGIIFRREKGSIDPKRLSNNFYHVCCNCDAKRFAQQKGVEVRKLWDMPVSSLKKLGRF